jgi:hypothetical protein
MRKDGKSVARLVESCIEFFRDSEEFVALATVASAEVGNEHEVRHSLATGTDPTREEWDITSPLISAVRHNDLAIAEVLLRAAASQGRKFSHGVMQECLGFTRIEGQFDREERENDYRELLIEWSFDGSTGILDMVKEETSAMRELLISYV